MAEQEEITTLAGLRRSRAPRRRPSLEDAGPGLFDLFPSPVGEPAAEDSVAAPTAAVAELRALPRASQSAPSRTDAEPLETPLLPVPSMGPVPAVPSHPQVQSATERAPLPQRASYAQAQPPDPEPDEPPATPPQTWSVSDLVRHVRGLVERGYGRVTVEGEISNWRPSGSGHCYFTVKDAGAQLSAVLFRRQASLLRFQPRDGDAVKLHGQLSIYESRGQMQLIVEWMQQAGLGALLAEVQRLKEQLRREGLFDRKRPLPPFPRCIGIITSLQGAALRDIVKVCRRRHAAVQLLIYPAAVQGPNAPGEIAAGLRWFNAHPDQAEVLLVARGGGSWEDLHGFDHEMVARAIATSVLPVITGIGHATDSTLADSAADMCAPTPSAAAELLTAAQHRVEEHLGRLQQRLLRACRFDLLRVQQRMARLDAGNVLRRVEHALNRRAQRVDELGFRLQAALHRQLRADANRLKSAETHLGRANPTVRLQNDRRRLETFVARLHRVAATRLTKGQRRAEAAHARLEALSPLRVLERGYALVYGADGHLLRSAADATPGQQISARLAEGTLLAEVLLPRSEPDK